MTLKVVVKAVEELKVGGSQFLMKPKLLSWIVRELNEGDKCLRVRNLENGRLILFVFNIL
jgi:hypothetical protein